MAGIAKEEAIGLSTNVYSSERWKASVICIARLSCCFGQRLQTQSRASAHAGCPCCKGRWESCCLQTLKTQKLLFANWNIDMKADFLNLQMSFSTCVSKKKKKILHLQNPTFLSPVPLCQWQLVRPGLKSTVGMLSHYVNYCCKTAESGLYQVKQVTPLVRLPAIKHLPKCIWNL